MAFDWLFLNAKDPTRTLWQIESAYGSTFGRFRQRGQGQHVTSLVCRFIPDLLQSSLKEQIVLPLPPSPLDTMPRPRTYSMEEVQNFTVKDIQGPE